jgi:adenylate cyclase
MGFSTPLLINNDCFHEIDKNPEEFISEIRHYMNQGGQTRIGHADVKMARHSSEFHLYAMRHNNLDPLDMYDPEFKELARKNPEYLKNLLLEAKKRITEALEFLSPKESVEIERRFLIEAESIPNLRNFKYTEIHQAYVPCNGIVVRIRTADENAYLTMKGPKKGASSDEFEYEIPFKDAQKLIRKYCNLKLSKRRYVIPHGDLKIELDLFKDNLRGLVIAEIEIPDENYPLEIPEWFGREITHDHEYTNIKLAERNAQ